jgi:hypothetical protein
VVNKYFPLEKAPPDHLLLLNQSRCTLFEKVGDYAGHAIEKKSRQKCTKDFCQSKPPE